MSTKISDIIKPYILGKMVPAILTEHMDFLSTGLATKDYDNVTLTSGGNTVEVPYYGELTGDDEVLTDATSLTPQKVSTTKDIGVIVHRGKAWGSRQLAAILSGDDPMKEVSRQLAKYWAYKYQQTLLAVLWGSHNPTNGVLRTTHSSNVAQGSGSAVTITDSAAITAMQLLGDQMGNFDVMICHSKVWADIVKAKLATNTQLFTSENQGLKNIPTYMGMQVIISDDVPASTNSSTGFSYIAQDTSKNRYVTYFAKKGVMYFGSQKEMQIETDRDILALEDVLASSTHFCPHLKLVKFSGTITDTLTNTALATGTNWTKIAESDKFIPCVSLITN